jgi:hypothetical protein
VNLEALAIGPAASMALLTRCSGLRVHSVFSSTVNLEVEGSDLLVALTGPQGVVFPQAVALRGPRNFATLALDVGDRGRLIDSCLQLNTAGGTVKVDLRAAARPVRRVLATITDFDTGGAFRACTLRLAEYQAAISADLRIEAVLGPAMDSESDSERTGAFLGAALCGSARALLAEARAMQSIALIEPGGHGGAPCRESFSRLISALLGAGRGLTPAGDDFLCGFLAAARATCPWQERHRLAAKEIEEAMCESIEQGIASTGEISASLLRIAMRGYWPGALADLTQGLAVGDRSGTLLALDELCQFGHSSGADIATGFLCGHHALLHSGAR